MSPAPPFEPWRAQHLAALVLAIAAAWLSVHAARGRFAHRVRPWLSGGLAVTLVGAEMAATLYTIRRGEWTIAGGLPLQICDVAVYATAAALLTRHQRSYELAYFWGLGGTIHGLLTPDLVIGFPHPACLKFFVTHVGIVVSAIYLSAGLGLRPAPGAVRRMCLATNLYAAAVGIVNAWLGTNYLYLCRKPIAPSLIDYLGPWPWYILGLEVVALGSFVACAAPFWLAARWRRTVGG
jgi:hypothetical integral membrane protein (TIGR02206 family)